MFGGAQDFILASILVAFVFCTVAVLFGRSLYDRETMVMLTIGILSILPLYFQGGD